MKNKVFYLKIVIGILIVLNAVSFTALSTKKCEDIVSEGELCYFESDPNFVLIEKNVLDKDLTPYLYKDGHDNYMSKIYRGDDETEILYESLIKEDRKEEYEQKVSELLEMKYPRFIVEGLEQENVNKAYVSRKNEVVIYYSGYEINPSVSETLFLTVNYNEIKDCLNYKQEYDLAYENESGYNYSNSKKAVAITFDDSPNPGKTTKILQSLRDNHFHATFFVVGEKCVQNEDLLINIRNNGNEIGSHTYKHQNMKRLKDEEVIADYEKMNEIYKKLFNEDLKYLRPPYGNFKDNQLSLLNVAYILWSLDTNDWRYRNRDYLVNYVVDNIKDGDIILFHDAYESSALAVEELLPILYSKGYQVMSVSELFKLRNLEIKNNNVYHKAV